MTVNKENMQLWIEALESDKFQQCHGSLSWRQHPDAPMRHCCLGVATEVAMAHGVELERVEMVGSLDYGTFVNYRWRDSDSGSQVSETYVLPLPVRQWLGVDAGDPAVWWHPHPDMPEGDNDELSLLDREHEALSVLNDDHDLTFAQIAKILRNNFLKEDTAHGVDA